VTIAPVRLPPNAIPRFYRGGPQIERLRGISLDGDRVPEEWIGSTTSAFGEAPLGLSRLPDGELLRDAVAADPEAWLGAGHVARFGADPALLVKLLDAGERLPVHVHPDGRFARAHLDVAYGKTEAWVVVAARPGARVHAGFRDDVALETLRGWVEAQDHRALLGALHPVDVSAGDAIFVPAGVAHAIGEGVLIVELQEPTDLSILLEWDGFGIADDDEATLGLGWDVALACVQLGRCDPAALRGPRADGPLADLLPTAADGFFRAHRVTTEGGAVALGRGFAVIVVLDGEGSIGDLAVRRGDAVLVPHGAGEIDARGSLVAICCRPPEASTA
jgi:mannose-6-phosphate isomerase